MEDNKDQWRKSGSGILYSVGKDSKGKKILRVKLTFNPKIETPKQFVEKTSRAFDNRKDNIYNIFRQAYVSKDKKAYLRMRNSLSKDFPTQQDRENYNAYLEVHKDEIKKYLTMQSRLSDYEQKN